MKELSLYKQLSICLALLLINVVFNIVIPSANPW